jgi:hypothetical protein
VNEVRPRYDAQKAEEAALGRMPAVAVQRRRFPLALVVRVLAFAAAIVSVAILVVQDLDFEFADAPIPLGLPYLAILTIEVGVASILFPLIWESPFRKRGWKVSRSVLYIVAAAIFAPIGAAVVVQLVGLVGWFAGTS